MFVVVSLDPPIRKEAVVESTLSLNEEILATKYKDRLEPSYKIDYVEFQRHGVGGSSDYVEFQRHGVGGSSEYQYFDLLLKLKSDQEHLFRSIQRNEYHNLFNFLSGKGLKILNLRGEQTVNAFFENDDDVDPHLERIKNAAGGEDEDFVIEKDDIGSPTDDSGGGSDASDNGAEKKNVKNENPGLTAPGIARALGEKWNKMTEVEQ